MVNHPTVLCRSTSGLSTNRPWPARSTAATPSPLVHAIVRQGGGHVIVDSAPGKGTVFKVYFPRQTDLADAPVPVLVPPSHNTVRGEGVVLLAEDDNDMRRFLVKALENAGFQVSSHDNGLSAYQRLREEPFEMLLTDIVMPEMDGIELARRASELDPDIKIMFITGFAAVALNSDSEAPKNAKVLSKPVHLRELVSEVNKMLAA